MIGAPLFILLRATNFELPFSISDEISSIQSSFTNTFSGSSGSRPPIPSGIQPVGNRGHELLTIKDFDPRFNFDENPTDPIWTESGNYDPIYENDSDMLWVRDPTQSTRNYTSMVFTNIGNWYNMTVLGNYFELNTSRGLQARQFYNVTSSTYTCESDSLVYKDNIIDNTFYVTEDEYPTNFILRLTNGSIIESSNITQINNYFSTLDNSTIWGVGIESFSGLMAFYLNFQDTDWGHGQYIYYPRLSNGSLPAYNDPHYAMYPHLYVNNSGTIYDQLLNNRALYDTPAKNPRNTLHFYVEDDTIGLYYTTYDISILSSTWDFEHGFKYNFTDSKFHKITSLNCLDRNFTDVGMAYEITSSPTTDGTNYAPDRFILRETNSSDIYANMSTAWDYGQLVNEDIYQIEIQSGIIDTHINEINATHNSIDNERITFIFAFEDMKLAGFTKTYLDVHDQLMPDGSTRKVLRAGMYGYGSYINGTTINIDPTYDVDVAEANDLSAYFISESYVSRETGSVGYAGYTTANSDERGFMLWDTNIVDELTDTSIVKFDIYQYSVASSVEADEYIHIHLIKHYSSDSPNEGSTDGTLETYGWYDASTAYVQWDGENQADMDLETLLDQWADEKGTDDYLKLRLQAGTGCDFGDNDRGAFDTSEGSTEPRITFDYTVWVNTAPSTPTYISGMQNTYGGKEFSTIITEHTDIDGSDDIDICHIYLGLTGVWYGATYNVDTNAVGETGSYMDWGSIASVSESGVTDGFRLTWTITLDWDFGYDDTDYDIYMRTYDEAAAYTSSLWTEAGTTTHETELIVYSTTITLSDSAYSEDGNTALGIGEWFRGGVGIKATGYVTYEGTTNVYPANTDVDVQMWVDNAASTLTDCGDTYDDETLATGYFDITSYFTTPSDTGIDTSFQIDIVLEDFISGATQGESDIAIHEVDRDNEIPDSYSLSLTADTITIGYIPNTGYYDDGTVGVSTSGASDGSGSGLHDSTPYSFQIESQGWSAYQASTSFTTSNQDDGSYDIYVRVIDNVGNIGSAVEITGGADNDVTVDTSNPASFTVTTSRDTGTADAFYAFNDSGTLYINTGETGYIRIVVNADGDYGNSGYWKIRVDVESVLEPIYWDEDSMPNTVDLNFGDGDDSIGSYIQVRVVNNAGNYQSISPYSSTVADTAAPAGGTWTTDHDSTASVGFQPYGGSANGYEAFYDDSSYTATANDDWTEAGSGIYGYRIRDESYDAWDTNRISVHCTLSGTGAINILYGIIDNVGNLASGGDTNIDVYYATGNPFGFTYSVSSAHDISTGWIDSANCFAYMTDNTTLSGGTIYLGDEGSTTFQITITGEGDWNGGGASGWYIDFEAGWGGAYKTDTSSTYSSYWYDSQGVSEGALDIDVVNYCGNKLDLILYTTLDSTSPNSDGVWTADADSTSADSGYTPYGSAYGGYEAFYNDITFTADVTTPYTDTSGIAGYYLQSNSEGFGSFSSSTSNVACNLEADIHNNIYAKIYDKVGNSIASEDTALDILYDTTSPSGFTLDITGSAEYTPSVPNYVWIADATAITSGDLYLNSGESDTWGIEMDSSTGTWSSTGSVISWKVYFETGWGAGGFETNIDSSAPYDYLFSEGYVTGSGSEADIYVDIINICGQYQRLTIDTIADIINPSFSDVMSAYGESGDTSEVYGVIATNTLYFSNSFSTSATITFTGTATDGGSNMSGIDYGGFGADNPAFDQSVPYQGVYTIATDDSANTLYVTAYDNVGNSNTTSITMTEDTTAPTGSISAISESSTYLHTSGTTTIWYGNDMTSEQSIIVSGSLSDTESGVYDIGDNTTWGNNPNRGGTPSSWQFDYLVDSADSDDFTITYIMYDNVGNNITDSVTVYRDITEPQSIFTSIVEESPYISIDGQTIYISDEMGTSDQTITVTVTSDDTGSNPSGHYAVNFGVYGDTSAFNDTVSTYSTDYLISSNEQNGSILIKAIDNVGNWESTITITIIDEGGMNVALGIGIDIITEDSIYLYAPDNTTFYYGNDMGSAQTMSLNCTYVYNGSSGISHINTTVSWWSDSPNDSSAPYDLTFTIGSGDTQTGTLTVIIWTNAGENSTDTLTVYRDTVTTLTWLAGSTSESSLNMYYDGSSQYGYYSDNMGASTENFIVGGSYTESGGSHSGFLSLVDNVTFGNNPSYSGSWLFTYVIDQDDDSSESFVILYTLTDNVGNEDTDTFEFILDNAPPAITQIADQTNETSLYLYYGGGNILYYSDNMDSVLTNYNAGGTASDSGSGLYSITDNTNFGNNPSMTGSLSLWTFAYQIDSGDSSSGDLSVNFIATDNCGNTNTDSMAFFEDNEDPILTITDASESSVNLYYSGSGSIGYYSDNMGSTVTSFIVYGSYSDPSQSSGLNSSYGFQDDTDFGNNPSYAGGWLFSYGIDQNDDSYGSFTITYRCYDQVNNTGTTTFQFILDNDDPTITQQLSKTNESSIYLYVGYPNFNNGSNYGFENGNDGTWTLVNASISASGSNVHTGTYGCRMAGGSNPYYSAYIEQDVVINTNRLINITYWSVDFTQNNIKLTVCYSDGTNDSATTSGDGSWQQELFTNFASDKIITKIRFESVYSVVPSSQYCALDDITIFMNDNNYTQIGYYSDGMDTDLQYFNVGGISSDSGVGVYLVSDNTTFGNDPSNSGSASVWCFNYSIDINDNGNYLIVYTITDLVNNSFTDLFWFVEDNTNPSISLDTDEITEDSSYMYYDGSSTYGYYSDQMLAVLQSFIINGSAIDSESGTYQVLNDQSFGNNPSNTGNSTDWQFIYQIDSTDSGDITVTLTIYDNVNNTDTITFIFYEDLANPSGSFTLTQDPDAFVNNWDNDTTANTVISGATDTESGFNTTHGYNYKIDTGSYGSWESTTNKAHTTTEGTRTIYITLKDYCNNTVEYTLTIYVDLTYPTLDNLDYDSPTYDPNWYKALDNYAYFYVNWTETNVYLLNSTQSDLSHEEIDSSPSADSSSFTITIATAPEDNYNITVEIWDKSGNYQSYSFTADSDLLKIDNTAPTTTFTVFQDSQALENNWYHIIIFYTNLTGSSDGSGSGLPTDYIKYRLNTQTFASVSWESTVDETWVGIDEYNNSIYCKLRDNVGHESTVYQDWVWCDTVDPVLGWLTMDERYAPNWYDLALDTTANIHINWVEDNPFNITMGVSPFLSHTNDTSPSGSSSDLTINLTLGSSGSYILSVTIYDKAGNSDSTLAGSEAPMNLGSGMGTVENWYYFYFFRNDAIGLDWRDFNVSYILDESYRNGSEIRIRGALYAQKFLNYTSTIRFIVRNYFGDVVLNSSYSMPSSFDLYITLNVNTFKVANLYDEVMNMTIERTGSATTYTEQIMPFEVIDFDMYAANYNVTIYIHETSTIALDRDGLSISDFNVSLILTDFSMFVDAPLKLTVPEFTIQDVWSMTIFTNKDHKSVQPEIYIYLNGSLQTASSITAGYLVLSRPTYGYYNFTVFAEWGSYNSTLERWITVISNAEVTTYMLTGTDVDTDYITIAWNTNKGTGNLKVYDNSSLIAIDTTEGSLAFIKSATVGIHLLEINITVEGLIFPLICNYTISDWTTVVSLTCYTLASAYVSTGITHTINIAVSRSDGDSFTGYVTINSTIYTVVAGSGSFTIIDSTVQRVIYQVSRVQDALLENRSYTSTSLTITYDKLIGSMSLVTINGRSATLAITFNNSYDDLMVTSFDYAIYYTISGGSPEFVKTSGDSEFTITNLPYGRISVELKRINNLDNNVNTGAANIVPFDIDKPVDQVDKFVNDVAPSIPIPLILILILVAGLYLRKRSQASESTGLTLPSQKKFFNNQQKQLSKNYSDLTKRKIK